MKDLLEAISHPRVFVMLAGAMGSAVYLLHEGSPLNWVQRLTTVAGGAATAHFLAHPIIAFLSLGTLDDGPATGFILGLFGMSLVGAAIRLVKAIDWATLRSLFPGGPK